MQAVKAFIERGNDGTYGVYVDLDDNTLNYGIHGEGNTAVEAIEDFRLSYEEMKLIYAEEKKKFVEANFSYVYDVASFLAYYGGKISLAGLEKITGINQGQLSHYVTGRRKPSKNTVLKIEAKLKEFAQDLNQIQFN